MSPRAQLVCVAFRLTNFGYCFRLFFLFYVLSFFNKIIKITIGHFPSSDTGLKEDGGPGGRVITLQQLYRQGTDVLTVYSS